MLVLFPGNFIFVCVSTHVFTNIIFNIADIILTNYTYDPIFLGIHFCS